MANLKLTICCSLTRSTEDIHVSFCRSSDSFRTFHLTRSKDKTKISINQANSIGIYFFAFGNERNEEEDEKENLVDHINYSIESNIN